MPDLKEADTPAEKEKGVIVLDSKGVYDKCKEVVITPNGKERRIDAELANSLTKPQNRGSSRCSTPPGKGGDSCTTRSSCPPGSERRQV